MQFKGYFHIQLFELCLSILRCSRAECNNEIPRKKKKFKKKCSEERVSLIKTHFTLSADSCDTITSCCTISQGLSW